MPLANPTSHIERGRRTPEILQLWGCSEEIQFRRSSESSRGNRLAEREDKASKDETPTENGSPSVPFEKGRGKLIAFSAKPCRARVANRFLCRAVDGKTLRNFGAGCGQCASNSPQLRGAAILQSAHQRLSDRRTRHNNPPQTPRRPIHNNGRPHPQKSCSRNPQGHLSGRHSEPNSGTTFRRDC